MPARVEVRDFVARRFQLRFPFENLRARFRIKIRRGKCGLRIRYPDELHAAGDENHRDRVLANSTG